ncbi:MAG: helix-turn-helix transcriptional regulator [Oscillospiraceae bacterium]|nr:helix-turn-helix transcriptional regulator [Oscillospiraceae bacterium]
MEPEITLRGAVYGKFKSISELAATIGWTRQKASNIVNGNVEPSLEDTDKLSKALGLGFERTARFFLND